MTEQHQKPESLSPTALLMMGLGGAKFAIDFRDPVHVRDVVVKLLTCHNHHFAVVGEGMTVVMSHIAVDCLRRAQMLHPSKTLVYEGDGRGE